MKKGRSRVLLSCSVANIPVFMAQIRTSAGAEARREGRESIIIGNFTFTYEKGKSRVLYRIVSYHGLPLFPLLMALIRASAGGCFRYYCIHATEYTGHGHGYIRKCIFDPAGVGDAGVAVMLILSGSF